MTWRPEEEQVIADLAAEGVEAIARELLLRCHSLRSYQAIRNKAARMGVSLRSYVKCPRCGKYYTRLARDGLCPTCHYRELADRTNRKTELVEGSVKRNEKGWKQDDARKSYNLARKRLSNARKQAGERRGDSV